MSVEVQQPRSRRALLAGLGGGIAALVATAAGRSSKVQAANGDTIAVGSFVAGTAETRLTNTNASGTPAAQGFHVISASAVALFAESPNYIAVSADAATNSQPAIRGRNTGSGTAIQGHSMPPEDSVPGSPSFTGVFATAKGPTATGVWGRAITPGGENVKGVYGEVTGGDGVGVWGKAVLGTDSFGVIGEGDVGVLGSSAAVGGYGTLGATYADGVGVYGSASDSAIPGVYGRAGVIGQADAGGTAVVGFTGLTAPLPTADVGIYGRSDTGGTSGRGLVGFCASGIGLLGQTNTGTGLRAYSGTDAGVALRVTGKAAFDRSGKLTIGASSTTVTKTAIALSSASFILATLQTNVAGLYVQSVVTNVAGSSFTIRLNKAPGVSVSVAWLAVN